ncbi:alpha/beta fold hydrolase [Streptomyces xinghaiensis]|uniref:alpha/beta fold hydrolase n=1 Tax=Streptomyces xinghaiensis TaxID=1038928 RepID=UPI002E142C80|nr:alpha/beta fold hydrolase [Streptomyces xinghaiensis]
MTDHSVVATTTGVRLAHRTAGEPGAPPLVLLHGLGESAADWDPVAAGFARHWHVLAPDLRGHGRSDWPGEYTPEAMRDDVVGFLDALGLGRVDLIGHSLGGVVAYLLAAAHPERVGRLVLEDVPAPFPREPSPVARPAGPLPFDWAAVTAVRSRMDRPDPEWWDRLGDITAPVLAVAGGPDSTVPQDRIGLMAERIPDFRMVTVPAGHLVHATRPAEFTEAVLRFLRPDGPDDTRGPGCPEAARGDRPKSVPS